jgi:hypothetical protein
MINYYISNEKDKTACLLGTYLTNYGFLGYGSEDTQGHRAIMDFIHSSLKDSNELRIFSSSVIPEEYKRISI